MKRLSVFMFLVGLLIAGFPVQANDSSATKAKNLAAKKTHVSSDKNYSSWDYGLTDGSWTPSMKNCFATRNSDKFPKNVTIDFKGTVEISKVKLGVPHFGSTKTVDIEISTDGKTFKKVTSVSFEQKKAEQKTVTFPAVETKFLRLTFPDFHKIKVEYDPRYMFLTEVEAYGKEASGKKNSEKGANPLDKPHKGSSVIVFGDSFSYGSKASDRRTTAYVPLIADSTGWGITNLGVPGYMMGNTADLVYTNNPTSSTNYIWYLGINEQHTYTKINQEDLYRLSMLEQLAWLGIQSKNKEICATSGNISYIGTWEINKGAYGGVIIKQSSSNDDTATVTVRGKNVIISYTVRDGNRGRFDLTIDGNSYGTFNNYGAGTIKTYVNARKYIPQAIIIPNLPEGDHVVKITVVSPTKSDLNNTVYLNWIGATDSTYDDNAGPNIYTLNIPRMTAAGYTRFGGSDAHVQRFNNIMDSNIALLDSIGINVVVGNVYSVIDPATDLSSDGIHPTDTGYAKIAKVLMRLINNKSQETDSKSFNIK